MDNPAGRQPDRQADKTMEWKATPIGRQHQINNNIKRKMVSNRRSLVAGMYMKMKRRQLDHMF